MNVHQFHPDDVIETSVGPMRVGDMTKRLGGHEDSREICSWREFWHEGKLVRRDVSIALKTVEAETRLGVFVRNLRSKARAVRDRVLFNS